MTFYLPFNLKNFFDSFLFFCLLYWLWSNSAAHRNECQECPRQRCVDRYLRRTGGGYHADGNIPANGHWRTFRFAGVRAESTGRCSECGFAEVRQYIRLWFSSQMRRIIWNRFLRSCSKPQRKGKKSLKVPCCSNAFHDLISFEKATALRIGCRFFVVILKNSYHFPHKQKTSPSFQS